MPRRRHLGVRRGDTFVIRPHLTLLSLTQYMVEQ